MKSKEEPRVPEFQSLEEEKKYWEAHGPLTQEHRGRVNRPKSGQKRSSFLAVRLKGEELTRLRDAAARRGLGPSTFARIILTSALRYEAGSPGYMASEQLKRALAPNQPQLVREQASEPDMYIGTSVSTPGKELSSQPDGEAFKREFTVIIERDEDGCFVGSIPEIRGCHTQAKSLDELMERIKEAALLCLEVQAESAENEIKFVGVQRITV